MEASVCYCDYEPFEFFRENLPRSRKPHACCECGETIPAGTVYQYTTARFDGRFWAFHTCLICRRIRRDYCAAYGFLRETLWELLECDYVGEWERDE